MLCLLLSGAVAWAAAAPGAEPDPQVEAFIDTMVERHGFERTPLLRAFRESRFQPSIIRAMDRPSTALPWHEFRQRHINDARIQGGLRFWATHADLLERAAVQYQVPAELIVATIGIETRYGQATGSIGVLDALTTLAFGYPRRADFFRGELEQFLLLARESGFALNAVKGSFAGAIGIPQFLPSSWRRFGVDFDGDGRRDLRQVADAIGSVAHYYRQYGWRPGAPVAVRAEAGQSDLDALLEAGVAPHTAMAEYRRHGVLPQDAVDDAELASLFAVEGETGIQFWLGLHNFYVITRYNRSVNYALVVSELATILRQQRARAAAP